jgi:hypothetical protein
MGWGELLPGTLGLGNRGHEIPVQGDAGQDAWGKDEACLVVTEPGMELECASVHWQGSWHLSTPRA